MKKYILIILITFFISWQVTHAQAPIITSFSPDSGSVGSLITITGTNLTNPTALTIGGVSAIPISNTGTSLVAMVMPGAITGVITVTTTLGTANSVSNFNLTASKVPNAQQGNKLLGMGNISSARQGNSVAISADGNTAIVGGYYDNSNQGAAWIFIRSGGLWTQQGSKLKGTGNVGAAYQGVSVSLSADGNTAMLGGYADNGIQGAAWVFTRSSGVWSQQGNKLVGTGNVGAARQGYAVSLSADGNTAIVGGYYDNSQQGAAWVFTRSSGGLWSQQGNKLLGTGKVGNAQQGWSVSLSADGNTAIVGGYYDNSQQGAAWVYTRSGGVWTQQGSKLVGAGKVGTAQQGWSVSLSADGNTAMVGGNIDNNGQGAAWVFTRSSGGVWSQQGNKLVGAGNTSAARQGTSVSLSADGNMAIVGGDLDNVNKGAAWTFTRSAGVWSQQVNKLVGIDNVGAAQQGNSVAISADGNTAIVGGYGDNNYQGAVWVFLQGPKITTSDTLITFSACIGTASSQQNFTINGAFLNGNITITAPTGFEVSTTSGSGFATSITLTQTNGTVATTTIYIRVAATASGTPGGNVTCTSGGAATQNIQVSGTVNTLPTIALGVVSNASANATSFSLPYNATTGSPNQYSITIGSPTAMPNFLPVTDATLPISPISVNIPASVANMYHFVATVKNIITGCVSDSNHFTVTTLAGSPPIISSFSPSSGPIGTLVTITGNNISNPIALNIGGVSAIPISKTGTSIVAMVMPGATTGGISITSAGGTTNFTGNFSVTASLMPSTQQGAKLVGTGTVNAAYQGSSIAISANGNTAIVGGYGDNNYQGAAWVFTRSNGVWSQQGSKLKGTGNVGAASQGFSIAISADGNTAILGGPNDDTYQGAVWIFTRSGGIWTQQGNKLVGADMIGNASQGNCVAISADGNTAIVGGSNDNSSQGAAWVFTRSGGVWTQQGNKLVGTGSVVAATQGFSVAISSDGNTAILGGVLDSNYQGAAWVFTRSNGVWTQQGNKLVGTGNVGAANQGSSVSLSADGNTAIVGGCTDNNSQGAIWVFTRSGVTWTQQGSKLVGTGNTGAAEQGWSVSLSANGNTAVAGGRQDNSNQGATWVYNRSGGIWTQQGNKLVGTGGVGTTYQGSSVSLSADGNTVIVGGSIDNNAGATWAFVGTNSNNANLSVLTLSSGILAPTFVSATTAYTATVANADTSIMVTPTSSQASATIQVRINGAAYHAVANANASGALALIVGSNTIDVRVTAQDGITQKTYTIIVTRNALPVKLISFEGVYYENRVSLFWKTASEINNDRFEIERSIDGINFNKIHTLKGNENSKAVSFYKHLDNSLPKTSFIYYRLKQIDYDSKFEYSNVIKINLLESKSFDMKVFPNPLVEGKGNLFIQSLNDTKGLIRVINTLGNIISEKTIDIKTGDNIISLNQTISSGVYLIQVTIDNQTQVVRFVK